jgi:3-aminobutyryl-CoA ammonia-lyase
VTAVSDSRIEVPDATLRVRLGVKDTHYQGSLIPAATVMRHFADCTTEIGIRDSGRPGLLAAYEKMEFLLPLRAGDYVEFRAAVRSRGRRSRHIALEAWRLIRAPEGAARRHHVACEPPELVACGTMISVTPKPADAYGGS